MKAMTILGLAILLAGANAAAQDRQAAQSTHEAAPAGLAEGEVRKIDREAGKLTLRHGEIRNLDMAAMTMVLRVQDPAMFEGLEVGDRVRFAAERVNGAITIVQIRKAP